MGMGMAARGVGRACEQPQRESLRAPNWTGGACTRGGVGCLEYCGFKL